MDVELRNGTFPIGTAKGKAFEILFAGVLCPRNRTQDLILAGKSGQILCEILTEFKEKGL